MAKSKRKPARPVKRAAKQPARKAKPARTAKPTRKPRSTSKPRTASKPRAASKPPRKPAKRAVKRKVQRTPWHQPVASQTGAVVQLIDAGDPIAALRDFLDGIRGDITVQQGQIALGAAQLMLLPIAREHRGGREVKELLDLVLSRWGEFPERTGFHAQELLRNAFAAVGEDRDRIAQLVALVPSDASAELRFNIACAYAAVGDRSAMLRAVEAALLAGSSPSAFVRDPDFAPYAADTELRALLERSAPPPIPVNIGPHITAVRMAIDTLVKTLREYGEVVRLEPPASLDSILAAERARRIQLPNDYRALLTITDGMTLWDHQFFGTLDYRTETRLAKTAREYLEASARGTELQANDCVPLASWGQPNDWLLYDPHGRYRNGEPGIVLVINAEPHALDGVAAALEHFDAVARDVLGTN